MTHARVTAGEVMVADALRDAASALGTVSDTARLDAEVLMAHGLGVSRSEMILRHMRDPAPMGFAALCARRMAQEPVAYIVGEQEFYGRPFWVTPQVLIPRGDSETIVDVALDACPAPARVLDCGVGSGALLLSVLAERPGAQGIGVDRSLGALAVAAANAGRHGLVARSRMMQRDWSEPGWAADLGQFDLILANPPYVEAGAALDRSVRAYEPAGALFAGADGLDDYKVLIPQLRRSLVRGGCVVLEIGHNQAEMVGAIARVSGFSTGLHHDLAGRPRAMILK